MDELSRVMPPCRYRVVAMTRGRYVCRHPAVRTRGGIVSQAICSDCAIQFAPCAQPRPLTADMLRLASNGDGQPREGLLRVGFVTPNLVLGEAERWIINLLRFSDPERIALAGVTLLNHEPSDEPIATSHFI